MNGPPPVVTTERLRLPLWTADETADIRAGRRRPHWHPDYPRQDDRDAATLWHEGDPWGPRHVVRGRTVLGSLGFFGPPVEPEAPGSPPEAEVGYGLVPEARGWGFATEALRAMLAETDRLGVKVRAGVQPDNRASIRVLAKCGFTELRGADEEGQLVMARPLPAAPRPAHLPVPEAPVPAPTPRLVATDLDGTLVRSDGSVSDYTRDVLLELDRRDVPVVFVTGRPLRWAEAVFEHVGSHGLAIVSNGALVWDVARERVHLERPISPELGLEVCRLVRAAVPGSTFAVESLRGISLEHDFLERHPVPPGSRRVDLEELFDGPALKLLARHEELEPEAFWDAAEVAVDGRLVLTWSSASALLEISGPGVTKASTLARLCAERGIDAAEVIAFGDMPNDLPMLTWAGTSYAMADAHPSVTEIADHVAPGHDEDGVARVLAGVFNL